MPVGIGATLRVLFTLAGRTAKWHPNSQMVANTSKLRGSSGARDVTGTCLCRQDWGASSGHPQQSDALHSAGCPGAAPRAQRVRLRLPHPRWHVCPMHTLAAHLQAWHFAGIHAGSISSRHTCLQETSMNRSSRKSEASLSTQNDFRLYVPELIQLSSALL